MSSGMNATPGLPNRGIAPGMAPGLYPLLGDERLPGGHDIAAVTSLLQEEDAAVGEQPALFMLHVDRRLPAGLCEPASLGIISEPRPFLCARWVASPGRARGWQ